MSDEYLAEDMAAMDYALASRDSQVEDRFPELEPGFFDPETGTFLKPVSSRELEVYKAISPHPRIVACLGLVEDDGDQYISLQYHPLGDLWTYLAEKSPPLDRRIQWAVEIAEGIAHLHTKSIVWADAHLRNILVTEDLHVVLADFAHSVVNPTYLHWFTTSPPPILAWPTGYLGLKPTYPDIFGFGVILYALLMKRFPWAVNLAPTMDEQSQAYEKHVRQEFDTLDDELDKCFGSILKKCFFPQYRNGGELLDEVKTAEASWRQKFDSYCICS